MPPVVRVEALGKRYRIRENPGRYGTDLADDLAQFVRLALRGQIPRSKMVDFWSIRNVSFDIQPGETVALLGKNGAGKSTLLKILARIVQPTEGRARLWGRVGSLLEVGTGFHPDLTGRENVFLSGAILGMRRREIVRKFDEIVAFSEIEAFLDTPVKRYSSGMYTRLAFAVAAHLETEILLVDEVLAVGDAAFQRKCLGKMNDVSRDGRTIVFISHQVASLRQLCRRGIVLDRGGVVEDAPIGQAIECYLARIESTATPAEWIAPLDAAGSDKFRPVRFAFSDVGGAAMSNGIGRDTEVFVDIEFEIQVPDPDLQVGYALYADDGTLLWWTFHHDSSLGKAQTLPVGKSRLRSPLPRKLLNEGRYRVELIAGIRAREWFHEPGRVNPVLLLEVQGGLTDAESWQVRRPGSLAPMLPWTLENG